MSDEAPKRLYTTLHFKSGQQFVVVSDNVFKSILTDGTDRMTGIDFSGNVTNSLGQDLLDPFFLRFEEIELITVVEVT